MGRQCGLALLGGRRCSSLSIVFVCFSYALCLFSFCFFSLSVCLSFCFSFSLSLDLFLALSPLYLFLYFSPPLSLHKKIIYLLIRNSSVPTSTYPDDKSENKIEKDKTRSTITNERAQRKQQEMRYERTQKTTTRDESCDDSEESASLGAGLRVRSHAILESSEHSQRSSSRGPAVRSLKRIIWRL